MTNSPVIIHKKYTNNHSTTNKKNASKVRSAVGEEDGEQDDGGYEKEEFEREDTGAIGHSNSIPNLATDSSSAKA